MIKQFIFAAVILMFLPSVGVAQQQRADLNAENAQGLWEADSLRDVRSFVIDFQDGKAYLAVASLPDYVFTYESTKLNFSEGKVDVEFKLLGEENASIKFSGKGRSGRLGGMIGGKLEAFKEGKVVTTWNNVRFRKHKRGNVDSYFFQLGKLTARARESLKKVKEK